MERAGARHVREHRDRIFAPPDGHQHLALGTELDEHVGAFVDRPDVVLRVDAHRVREGEAVVVAADLAHEVALRRVLEQPRLVGAVVDVDVALRVGRDAHVLAGVDAGRVLEEIWHRFVRDHRNVGRRGPGLGRKRLQAEGNAASENKSGEGPQDAPKHGCLRKAEGFGSRHDRAGNVPDAACGCKALLHTAAVESRLRTTAPRVLLRSRLFARGYSSKRRTGPVGSIAEVVVNAAGQRGGAERAGSKRSTLTTAVPCVFSRTRTVTAAPAVSCTA